jgi:hypothetical protein
LVPSLGTFKLRSHLNQNDRAISLPTIADFSNLKFVS